MEKGSAACSRSPRKQKRTVLLWTWAQVIPCLFSLVLYHIRLAGSLSTLSALGVGSCQWDQHIVTHRLCHGQCVRLLPTCLLALAARHTHFMRFASCMTKPGQRAHSTPTPGHSDWVRMGPWAFLGLGGSLQPLGRNVVSTEEGGQGRKDTTTQDQCLSSSMSLGLLFTWPVTSLCCWYQLEQNFNFHNNQVHKHYFETKSSLGSVNYSSSDQGCPLNHNLYPTHPHSNQA